MPHNHKTKIFSEMPWFLFLLPVFFVFHGSNENFGFISFTDAFKLILFYTAAAAAAAFVLKFILKQNGLATLFVFFAMAFFLFFGSMHDWLKHQFAASSLFTKYSFIVPAFLLLIVLITGWLYKSPWKIKIFSNYLNILFLLLILIEEFQFIKYSFDKDSTKKLPAGIIACSDCAKPDIYFLLFDEYAGKHSLKNNFNFDNSEFELELKQKGFYFFNNSTSNYNYTPFSMASMLNMEYLSIQSSISAHNQPALGVSLKKIKNCTVKNFFEQSGYEFINLSIFDFEGKPAPLHDEILPVSTRLITGQTFLQRANRDLWFNLITRFKTKKAIYKSTYFNLNNNNNILKLTKESVLKKSLTPRFIYSHIRMPHFPYYFNSSGAEQPFEKLGELFNGDTSMYIQYLKYTNRQIISLINFIKSNSPTPPIIILMSDHGFRHFNFPVEEKNVFQNMNAIFFPDLNYVSMTDSISAVNQFSVILNSRFKQNIPILKDSTFVLSD